MFKIFRRKEKKEKTGIELEAKIRKLIIDCWEQKGRCRINKEDIPDLSIQITREVEKCLV